MNLRVLLRSLCAICLGVLFLDAYASPEITMTEVIFEESEPGIEPFTTRILLSDAYLRLDDGSDAGDFILFERKTGQIHSFNREEETHLQINPGQVAEIDFKIDFRIEKKILNDAPKINAVTPIEYRYLANGKECRQSVNIDGLMPDMAKVMRDYEQALVEHSRTTFSRVPASMRTACYMANNYLYASEYLKSGFPLHVVDYEGRQKRLVSFQTVKKPQSIVKFPDGYRVYHPQ